jgi:hypothetical protein
MPVGNGNGGVLRVHHIDVEQADAALIIAPNGQVAMVDNGRWTGCGNTVSYAQGLGISTIAYHFATHYDADHIGCLDDLAAAGITIGTACYDRGGSKDTDVFDDYVAACGAKRQTATKGQVVTLDAGSVNPVTISVNDLNGAGVSTTEENALGLVRSSHTYLTDIFAGDLPGESPDIESVVGQEVGDVEPGIPRRAQPTAIPQSRRWLVARPRHQRHWTNLARRDPDPCTTRSGEHRHQALPGAGNRTPLWALGSATNTRTSKRHAGEGHRRHSLKSGGHVMRKRRSKSGITVNGIAGTYVVVLGLDLSQAKRQGCLGFAIQREDHTEGERYWLRGMKTFRETDPVLGPGGQVSSREHPYQTFQWSDYSAKPDHDYTYTVVPLYGTPQHLEERGELAVRIRTESEWGKKHSVFFNRGAAASQEYARRFLNQPPSKSVSPPLAVLRAEEALLAFVGARRLHLQALWRYL